jgi:hypothetical protein
VELSFKDRLLLNMRRVGLDRCAARVTQYLQHLTSRTNSGRLAVIPPTFLLPDERAQLLQVPKL